MELIAPLPSQKARPFSDEENDGASEASSVEVQLKKWQDVAPGILNPVVASLEVEKRDYYKRRCMKEQREDCGSILESDGSQSSVEVQLEDHRVAPMVLRPNSQSLKNKEEHRRSKKNKKKHKNKKRRGSKSEAEAEEREQPDHLDKHGFTKADLRMVEEDILPSDRPTSAKSPPSKQHVKAKRKGQSRSPKETHPSSTKTFPVTQNKKANDQEGRHYPEENWVATSHPLGRSESNGVVSTASSTDQFLKSYSKFGKYDVDTTSILRPLRTKFHGEEEERYGVQSPPLDALSKSFDSGAPEWRSEDEDDEEPDWDMSMIPAERSIRNSRKGSNEDQSHSSIEMVNYDGTKVQILMDKHRFDSLLDQESTLFDNEKKKPSFSLKRWKMKKTRKPKSGKPSKKSKGEKPEKGLKKAKNIVGINQNESGSEFKDDKGSDPGSKQSLSFVTTPPLLKNSHRNKTMSTLTNSVAFSVENVEKPHTRTRLRQVDSMESFSDVSEGNEDDKYSEYLGSNHESGDEDELSACSSGSLSTRAQMEFRKKKRQEHLCYLKKRRREQNKSGRKEIQSLESDDWDDYNEEDRAKALKAKSTFRTMKNSSSKVAEGGKKLGFFGLFKRKSKADKDKHDETTSHALPWEEKKQKGLLQRAAAKLLPRRSMINSVDRLPFPTSESIDGSLADLDEDKYGEIFEHLPTLIPADIDHGSISSTSYSFPRHKLVKLQSKKGLGGKLRLFH